MALFIVECSLYENKPFVSRDDYMAIFDLMFKENMLAYTFPGLLEVDRAVVDVWIKQASPPVAAASMSGAVPKRSLNILFTPAERMI
ncbi:MAG: hypothetical protein VYB57_01895 [Cyanobacteriota bacterium]|nr:hypothetical protein [Cyanobacteriota bacterium]